MTRKCEAGLYGIRIFYAVIPDKPRISAAQIRDPLCKELRFGVS